MTSLCLDLGTQMGYCHDALERLESGTISLKSKKDEDTGQRYWVFYNFLDTMHKAHPLKRITYEKVIRHRGSKDAHAYGAYQGILQMFCFSRNIPLHPVMWQTIKKAVTGNWKAKKAEMIAEIVRRGHSPKDDNEADAISLYYTTQSLKV